jgi:hypothetical protein
MASAARFTKDKVAMMKNGHITQVQQDSFKRIPAGQGNTVAVSGQYDPRQKASELFLNITPNGSFPLLE